MSILIGAGIGIGIVGGIIGIALFLAWVEHQFGQAGAFVLFAVIIGGTLGGAIGAAL